MLMNTNGSSSTVCMAKSRAALVLLEKLIHQKSMRGLTPSRIPTFMATRNMSPKDCQARLTTSPMRMSCSTYSLL